jgi:hypothetical protein
MQRLAPLLSSLNTVHLHVLVQLADILTKCITAVGILAGGLWAYFHYFRGRLYHPKLELAIDLDVSPAEHLIVLRPRVKNVGLSRVDLDLESSGIRVSEIVLPATASRVCNLEPIRLGTFDVFQGHDWIEAGEPLEDVRLVVLPSTPRTAVLATLRIVGRRHSWFGCSRTFQWSTHQAAASSAGASSHAYAK